MIDWPTHDHTLKIAASSVSSARERLWIRAPNEKLADIKRLTGLSASKITDSLTLPDCTPTADQDAVDLSFSI
jgi:hypothetical protein